MSKNADLSKTAARAIVEHMSKASYVDGQEIASYQTMTGDDLTALDYPLADAHPLHRIDIGLWEMVKRMLGLGP